MTPLDMNNIAGAAANAVVDSVMGEFVRRLAQAEARAAVLSAQLDAANQQLQALAAKPVADPVAPAPDPA